MAKYTFFDIWRAQRTPVPPVLRADLTGKTVIVVGANNGLGFEVAFHFARMNPGKLVLACRSQQRGDEALSKIKAELPSSNVEVGLVDLSNFTSVIRFAEAFKAQNGRLDLLVCNAGIGNQAYEVSPSGWESTLQVNHLSTALLSLLLLPLLDKTGRDLNTHPRLVIVSSDVHFFAQIHDDVRARPNILERLSEKEYCTYGAMLDRYNVTKLLNVLYTRALASRLSPTSPVIINTVNPGLCYSNLRKDMSFLIRWVSALMELVLARTTEEGAREIVWAALAGDTDGGNASLREQTKGAFISDCVVSEASDWVFSPAGQESEQRIWEETLQILAGVDPKIRDIVGQQLLPK